VAVTSPSGVDSLMMSAGLSSGGALRRRLLGNPTVDSASVNEMFLPLTIFKETDPIKVA
jgi:hypothetical protein